MRADLDLSLYLITDPLLCAGRGLVETVRAAVRGGVTMVQLRDKTAGDAALIDQGRALRAALAGTGVPLIINDRLAVAVAVGADGVHLGQDDAAVAAVRARLGPTAIIGLSVRTPAQARALDPRLIDYLGTGPVFATATKPDHAAPLGFAGLAAVCRASPLPVVAIGGLTADHGPDVLAAGAVGLAVVSAICGAPDPAAAARACRAGLAAGAPARPGEGPGAARASPRD